MPALKHNYSSQNNMSPLKLSNLMTAGPEKREITEVQDKDFKIAFMNMPDVQRK